MKNIFLGYGYLIAVLVLLKIADIISWSWWVVLMPLYVPVALVLLIVLALLVLSWLGFFDDMDDDPFVR